MNPVLQIGSTTYQKSSNGVFEVPWELLDGLRFTDIPYYSTVDVTDFPGDADTFELSVSAIHGGGPNNEDFSVMVHVHFSEEGGALDAVTRRACERRFARIRRAFRPLVSAGVLDDGEGGNDNRTYFHGAWFCDMLYSARFSRAENPVLADFLSPVVEQFCGLVETPGQLLFLCHASEDKHFVETLASFLEAHDLELWYDKREIRAGDSIVERVSEGLGIASHLVIVLSRASVRKPWVQRELSSALMNQLKDSSITVIPVLSERCSVPVLLSDIRHVDCSDRTEAGFQELVDAVA